MTTVKELKAWLNSLAENSSVGVDEGGLTLVEIRAGGGPTEAYYEVGGVYGPYEDLDPEEMKDYPVCPICGGAKQVGDSCAWGCIPEDQATGGKA